MRDWVMPCRQFWRVWDIHQKSVMVSWCKWWSTEKNWNGRLNLFSIHFDHIRTYLRLEPLCLNCIPLLRLSDICCIMRVKYRNSVSLSDWMSPLLGNVLWENNFKIDEFCMCFFCSLISALPSTSWGRLVQGPVGPFIFAFLYHISQQGGKIWSTEWICGPGGLDHRTKLWQS